MLYTVNVKSTAYQFASVNDRKLKSRVLKISNLSTAMAFGEVSFIRILFFFIPRITKSMKYYIKDISSIATMWETQALL